MIRPELRAAAESWIDDDPDEQTRGELRSLLDRATGATGAEDGEAEATIAELEDRFAGTLEFGTAGLRGALGAGPNRMNRVVVLRAAAGLAAYLRDTGAAGPVVIGYDARHNSDVFARDTAAVMTGAGIEALLLPRPLPTPLLAFAIGDQAAAAGVMVTASHNPPQDNGYKVYLGDGSQIVPPADAEIAARIAAVGPVAQIPLGDGGVVLDDTVIARYLDRVASLAAADGPRAIRIVHTALHGVGSDLMIRALRQAGFADPDVVPEQADPDPDFPTVAFPNPEEPGAMDLALARAAEVGADIVIASDPDADRCAVAVPVGGPTATASSEPSGWRVLRGDEVGALLADHLLRQGVEGTYACSIVSSSLLGRLAEAHGQPFVETLTGFKWIGRVAGLAFGYEEALGYCVDPTVVKDKDGISAGIRVAELAALLKSEGRSLLDRLDEIAVAYGVHATDQLSVRVTDLTQISDAMTRLRTSSPSTLAGLSIESIDDLALGSADLPPTDGLRYRLGGARVIVRPSGTEPKLKCYLEAVVPVDGDLGEARTTANDRLAALRADIAAAAGL